MVATLKRKLALVSLVTGALAIAAPSADAQTWVNWTSVVAGSATGTLALPTGTVTVTVAGNTIGGQTSGAGTNYWTPTSTWSGGGQAPTNTGFVQLDPSSQIRVTFSGPVDLYMALLSVGRSGAPVTYDFGTSGFTIVSQGPSTMFSGCATCLVQTGNTVAGSEGDGTLHFTAPVTTLSFSTNPGEFWHGFTFGANAVGVTATPEPATLVLFATGLLGVAGAARRKRKA